METIISGKKELAEKKQLAETVAGMLGMEAYEAGMKEGPVLLWTHDNPTCDIRMDGSDLNKSWTLAGLCIEKAREMGWEFSYHKRKVYFYLFAQNSTLVFKVEEYGHIEAIIRAFAEIPMEVEGC